MTTQFIMILMGTTSDVDTIDESLFTLRPYQQEAIDALDQEWNGIRLLHLPCGTGKTIIFNHHVKNKGYKHVFIISPLRVHVKQNLKRMKQFLKEHDSLLLDSDSGGTTDFEDLQEILKNPSIVSSTFISAKNVMKQLFFTSDGEEELDEDSEDEMSETFSDENSL